MSTTTASGRPVLRPMNSVLADVRLWAAAICLGFAALVTVFPLGLAGDFANHLAKLHIQLNLAQSETLQAYYTVEWRAAPNLASELIAAALGWAMDVYAIGAALTWLALALPGLAGLAIARHLHGRSAGPVGLIGFAAAFHATLQYGFINYSIALGAALFAFYGWMRLQPGWRRTALFAALGAGLTALHAFAFLLLGFLVLTYELANTFSGERVGWRSFGRNLVLRMAPAFAPGLIFVTWATIAAGGSGAHGFPPYVFPTKLETFTAAFAFHNPQFALLATAMTAGFFISGLWMRWLVIRRDMAIVCAAMLGLAILAPTAFAGIWGLHLRFSAALVVLLAASCRIADTAHARTAVAANGAAGALVAMALLNGAVGLRANHGAQSAFRPAFAAMEDGARILPARRGEVRIARLRHAPNLAVIEANAYVPSLFTDTSIIGVASDMASHHRPGANPARLADLYCTADAPVWPAGEAGWTENFTHGWRTQFDYVVYLRAAGDPAFHPAYGETVREAPYYAILRPTPAS